HDTPNGHVLGPTWEQLYGPKEGAHKAPPAWWQRKQAELLKLGQAHGSAYVYDRDTLSAQVSAMKQLSAVGQVFFAMKANPHPEILKLFAAQGLGLECVSRGELERVFEVLPQLDRKRVLFTPNFAPQSEYEFAFKQNVWVTLDNLYPLQTWPELFK